jgi:predicted aspartyl protease
MKITVLLPMAAVSLVVALAIPTQIFAQDQTTQAQADLQKHRDTITDPGSVCAAPGQPLHITSDGLISGNAAASGGDSPAQKAQAVSVSLGVLGVYGGSLLVIPVMINGSGPYDFLLDTGTTTTIIDAALFQKLGMRRAGAMVMTTMTGEKTQAQAIAREIAVKGLSRQNVNVMVLPVLPLGPFVRGVLGANFLSHFDLLIDNQHRQITLDAGSSLADSFDGERLPMSSNCVTTEGETLHRPMVSVTLPSIGSHPLPMVLDSAAEAVVIFRQKDRPWRNLGDGSANQMMETMAGPLSCKLWQDRVRWGSFAASGVDMLMCEDAKTAKLDSGGSVPTRMFKRVLISHANSYVIVNPIRRSSIVQKAAIVLPPR